MNNRTADEFERPDAFAVLRQFSKRRVPAERCELCSAELASVHQHLLQPSKRQILCACDACAVLFCSQDGGHYLRIPRRIRLLSDFKMTDLRWESLMLPINLAFFYRDGKSGKMIALYPSPAGATESLLSLESWDEIVAENAVLRSMEPDVEALLTNRVAPSPAYFLAPIDECYRLVGLIRIHWRGLSGGPQVWTEIQQFFADLAARSVAHKAAVSA